MRCPIDYVSIPQTFSLKHRGVDFGWYNHHNQPVYSCESGKVIYNRYQTSGGYTIIIKHDNGYCSVYGHLLKDSQKVHEGDSVKKGQQIANMGASGNVKGEHLHFAIYKGNKVMISKVQQVLYYKDPLKYINIYDKQTANAKANSLIKHTKKVTAKDGLNIRNAASTKGKVVSTVKYGEEVETYGLKNGWNIVDNIRGYYCSNNYLK